MIKKYLDEFDEIADYTLFKGKETLYCSKIDFKSFLKQALEKVREDTLGEVEKELNKGLVGVKNNIRSI